MCKDFDQVQWQSGAISIAQERLWHLYQREPESPLWRVVLGFRLHQPVSTHAVSAAFHQIADDHPVLRWRFQPASDGTARWFQGAFEPTVVIEEFGDVSEEEVGTELEWYLADVLQDSLDWGSEPPIALHLLRTRPDEQLLVCIIPRMLCDESRAEYLARQLAFRLAAQTASAPAETAGGIRDYADYVAWQRSQFATDAWAAQRAWWQSYLSPPSAALPLPQGTSACVAKHTAAVLEQRLPSDLAQGLIVLADRLGVNEADLYTSAFVAVLHLFTGSTDVALALRDDGAAPAWSECLGPFAAYWPLRCACDSDQRFDALTRQISALLSEQEQHRGIPCDEVWRLLTEEPIPPWPAPLNVCFSFATAPAQAGTNVAESAAPQPVIERVDVDHLVATFAWDLRVIARCGERVLRFRYDRSLTEPDTARQLLAVLRALLVAAQQESGRSLSALVHPQDAVVDRAIESAVATSGCAVPGLQRISLDETLVARFEHVVRHHPERQAIDFQGEGLSYEQIDRRANGIAAALCDAAGSADIRVALLFSQSALGVCAMLGALKAGMAYVPMDAAHPEERLRQILCDSAPGILVTASEHRVLAETLVPSAGALLLADAIAENTCCPQPIKPANPDSEAYILYTSGSTGQPKGVAQSQRNVLHFVRAYGESLGIGPEDRLSLVAPYNVDAAVMDVFGSLLHGATLCPLKVTHGGLAELSSQVHDKRISVFHSTPTLYRHFMASLGEHERLASVRLVIMGGESVSRKDLESFNAHFMPECRFVNWFGSSESSLTLQCVLPHGSQVRRQLVPAGYPVADTEVVLIDRHGREAPILGELAVRSRHIALKYWMKPEATARTFAEQGTGEPRLYRSGDLLRRLPDGSYEFIGRQDFQVKVRGFRVELEEVEAALRTHESIQACAVVPAPDAEGTVQLKALYVAAPDSEAVAPEALHRYLAVRLPAYMIPSAFLPLERLPLTATGKIDRVRLTSLAY